MHPALDRRATGSTTAIGGCSGASITSSIALHCQYEKRHLLPVWVYCGLLTGLGYALRPWLGFYRICTLICYFWYSYCHPRICWIWITICGLYWLCLRNCNLVNWFFVLQLDKGLALVMLMDLLLVL